MSRQRGADNRIARCIPRLEYLEDRTLFAIGAFDPTTATWFLRTSSGPGAPDAGQFQFGPAGSIPVVGDWNGDGKQDIGVVDPTTMIWYLHYGTNAGSPDAGVFQYGGVGTVPIVGDWNGDGRDDIGVVAPASMTWLLHFNATAGNPDAGVFQYGGPGSRPIAGDWDGNGTDGIGVTTPDLTWLLRPTATPGPPTAGTFSYGGVGWTPVDGKFPVAPLAPTPPANTGAFNITMRLTGLTASQQAAFQAAATRLQQIIIGDLPNATYRGIAVDDILMDISAEPIDGVGGVLAQAGPDAFRRTSRLPYHGTMTFDTADIAQMEARGRLRDVAIHEMAHILGFGTIWDDLGLISGSGTANPRFLGPRAVAEYNAIFQTAGNSVPVEGLPSGPGSADGHWRESVFGDEVMGPYESGNPTPLSRITVAAFADMGYIVNIGAADPYTPRRG